MQLYNCVTVAALQLYSSPTVQLCNCAALALQIIKDENSGENGNEDEQCSLNIDNRKDGDCDIIKWYW